MKTCRAKTCGRAIPSGQEFCRACLEKLAPDVRHPLLFGSNEDKRKALELADKQLSGGSIPPVGSARERFRAARVHAQAAMRTLEGKGK